MFDILIDIFLLIMFSQMVYKIKNNGKKSIVIVKCILLCIASYILFGINIVALFIVISTAIYLIYGEAKQFRWY